MAQVVGLDQTPPQDDGAVIEGDYRYLLWRTWDATRPRVLWVMLNPSCADCTRTDNTLQCCIRISRNSGFGSLEVVNLFAFRTPYPKELPKTAAAIGAQNDAYIAAASSRASRIVVAWGSLKNERQRERAHSVLELLRRNTSQKLECLEKKDHPPRARHPARLKRNALLIPYPGQW